MPCWSSNRENRKKNKRRKKSLSIWDKRLKNKLKLLKNKGTFCDILGESRSKNKRKFKDSDNCNKRPQTDKPSSMLWEPKGLLKLMKEQRVKNKDNKQKSEQRRLQNSKSPVHNNKWKSKKCSNSKPEQKRRNSNRPFASSDKLESLKKSLSKKERKSSRSMLLSWRSKSYRNHKNQNRIRSRKMLRIRRPNSCTRKRRDC